MDTLVNVLAGIGALAVAGGIVAALVFLFVFSIYISLAGWTAIVASGTLFFAAPVTSGGVIAFLISLVVYGIARAAISGGSA
jgi:hypothetical protein